MKLYAYYLKGSDVNHQMTCKPKWFILRVMKYASVLRVWRLQLTLQHNG